MRVSTGVCRPGCRPVPLVPVANASRLVPCTALFVRLRDDLSPFGYEVPTSLVQRCVCTSIATVRMSYQTVTACGCDCCSSGELWVWC